MKESFICCEKDMRREQRCEKRKNKKKIRRRVEQRMSGILRKDDLEGLVE